jgi:hypothetical protein
MSAKIKRQFRIISDGFYCIRKIRKYPISNPIDYLWAIASIRGISFSNNDAGHDTLISNTLFLKSIKDMYMIRTAVSFSFFVAFLFIGKPVTAQDNVREYLLLGVEIAEELTAAYTEPAAVGLMYGMTGGWYNSAMVRDTWDVELSIVTNGSFVPSDARTFFIDTNEYEELTTLSGEARVEVPTILGGNATPATLVANVQGEIFQFETPRGLGVSDLNLLPNAFLQAKVGLPFATEIGIRVFPKINVDDVELGLYGIGLQHEFSRWIEFIDQSPVALSVFGAFTILDADYVFATGGDVLGENQRITIDMDSWLFEMVASTRFEKLNFFAGFGYVTGQSDTRLRGTYEVQTRTPVTFTDPFDFQNEVSGARANLGANLRLGWFGLNAAYTFQGYNNLSVGMNFNIR